MTGIYQDNSETIGNTPLVKINRISQGNILAKIESRNPAGSVKCRIGASMVQDAEKSGKLKPGMTLVEPTSGNTGIALAYVAAARGYDLVLTMPDSMSLERRKILKALGAKLVLTPGLKGMPGAIAKAEELVQANPDTHLMLQQFDNPANPAIHEKTTGPEIWEATGGDVDVLVSGVGTGGTITGVARYFKNTQGKAITAVAVEPETAVARNDATSGARDAVGDVTLDATADSEAADGDVAASDVVDDDVIDTDVADAAGPDAQVVVARRHRAESGCSGVRRRFRH